MASSEDQEWSFLSDLQEADVVGTFDAFDSSLPDVEIHTCASDSLSNMDPAVASNPTVDASGYDADREDAGAGFSSSHLGVALNFAFQSAEPVQLKQVWETGVWSQVFGNNSIQEEPIWGPRLTRPLPSNWGVSERDLQHSEATKRLKMSSFSFSDVVSFKPDIPWKDQRESDLQRSLNLWLVLVDRWDPSCSLLQQMSTLSVEDSYVEMFAHIFTGRAPVTIRKRGFAIMKICDFLEVNNLFAFPLSEPLFYRFLCSELRSGAPVSRLHGYVQAIAFCRHVLDVTELQPLLTSMRCKGIASSREVRERKQASPLTVKQLLQLHELVEDQADEWTSLFAGAALLAAYSRARWGDLMRTEAVIQDCDEEGRLNFLETRVGRHKTMNSSMHRHQFLPMVAPVVGVHGKDWATPWIDLRKKMDVPFPPQGLIMPAPDQQGKATCRPLESGECGKWLRKLFACDDGPGESGATRTSSHSLKATFLSYAAKYGLPVPDRLLLGYHSSHMRMAMVYSRDGAASSLLLLEKLIKAIYTGSFKPDSARSGRFTEVNKSPSGPEEMRAKIEVIESSDNELEEDLGEGSWSSSSTSSSSSASVCSQEKINKAPAPPEPPVGFTQWQHSKLKTIHLTAEGYSHVFVCGRPVGVFHSKTNLDKRFDSPVCWACFKKAAA